MLVGAVFAQLKQNRRFIRLFRRGGAELVGRGGEIVRGARFLPRHPRLALVAGKETGRYAPFPSLRPLRQAPAGAPSGLRHVRAGAPAGVDGPALVG